jgi:hypothetical protein
MLFWDICKLCEVVNNRWRGRGIYNIGLFIVMQYLLALLSVQ